METIIVLQLRPTPPQGYQRVPIVNVWLGLKDKNSSTKERNNNRLKSSKPKKRNQPDSKNLWSPKQKLKMPLIISKSLNLNTIPRFWRKKKKKSNKLRHKIKKKVTWMIWVSTSYNQLASTTLRSILILKLSPYPRTSKLSQRRVKPLKVIWFIVTETHRETLTEKSFSWEGTQVCPIPRTYKFIRMIRRTIIRGVVWKEDFLIMKVRQLRITL